MATKYPTKTKFQFTTKALDNLKPADKPYQVTEGAKKYSGLALRVLPSGRKVFRWQYNEPKPGGGQRSRAITFGKFGDGHHGTVTLSEAHNKLLAAKEAHRNRREYGEELPDEVVTTVAGLADVFYRDRIEKQRKRPLEAKQILDDRIVAVLGKRKLDSVTTQAVGAMVAKVVNDGATVRAGKVLAIAKQMFRFGVGRGYLASNPAASLDPVDLGVERHTQGKRYLSGGEIATFYTALQHARGITPQVCIAWRLLLLTGVRTGELLRAKWDNVDLEAGTWTIPVADQKVSPRHAHNREPFVIALPLQAVELFRQLETLATDKEGKRAPYVMASAAAAEGRYTDKALAMALRRLFRFRGANGALVLQVPHFTPHDLRRTLRTHLSETLAVDPAVAEKVLNHRLGPLEATYNKATLAEGRKAALQRFADWVDNVTGEGASNVTELRA